jgi:hypothetical protein
MRGHTNFLKENVKFFIFTMQISLHGYNFTIKLLFKQVLIFLEKLINIKAFLEQINPSKLTKMIY